MLNDTTQLLNYSKLERNFDRITSELVNILYSSPKSFVYLLKLAFGNAFGLTSTDVQRIIDGITSAVGPGDLQKYLVDIENVPEVEIKSRPVISANALKHLENDDFQLAALLARHQYGDMSETAAEQVDLSQAAVQCGYGVYITNYKLGNAHVMVSTRLPSYDTAIDIF
ncbi:hypothetical protein DFO55_12415 [Grimontella sp. AG753]|nr:hypothetical protein DFO55_12415 [Grimontella sp. AG753]